MRFSFFVPGAPDGIFGGTMAKPFYKNLTVQVLTAIVIGAMIAIVSPKAGMALKPLADGFIRLVKMVVTPIIFLTVVVGIASIGNLRKAGRVGLKAIVYFEVVTTLALAIGLFVANVVKPGEGFDTRQATVNEKVKTYEEAGKKQTDIPQFLLHVIPSNV